MQNQRVQGGGVELREALASVVGGGRLSAAVMEAAIGQIMTGQADPVQAAGLLTALATRGETVDEVAGAARAMRRHMARFPSAQGVEGIDTCGTGGDGAGTFNISTAAAFVVASAGVLVAKHGNRAVSSRSGSADVLAALGAAIDLAPESMARVYEGVGIGFLFAPVYHPAMRYAMPVRRSLGVRTIFNLLGPISNPAGVLQQVVGVFHPRWLDLAEVLGRLGSRRAMVVHGEGGLDELALTGETQVAELVPGGQVRRYTLSPGEVGLARCQPGELRGGDAAENAAMLRACLGAEAGGAVGRAVQYNAGAAIYVAGRAPTLAAGVLEAGRLMREGAALAKVEAFIAATQAEASR